MQKYQAQQRERCSQRRIASETDRLAGRRRRPPRVFVFGLEDKSCSPNEFGLGNVRVKRMFEKRGTIVFIFEK